MAKSILLDKVVNNRKKIANLFKNADYIYKLSAQEISFRAGILPDVSRNVLECGPRCNYLQSQVLSNMSINSYDLAFLDKSLEENKEIIGKKYDLILSNLNLHLFKDLKLELMKLKFLLAENGFLIFTVYGPGSLRSLKKIFLESEVKIKSEVNRRFWDLEAAENIASIVQASGFRECIIDSMNQEFEYKNLGVLHQDLKIMCDNSHQFNSYLGKELYNEIQNKFIGNPVENFEIITVTASI